MGSASQVSTTGSTSHSIETPDINMHDDDVSFTSTPLSPSSGPSSYGHTGTPIVVSGLNASKRQKMSRTSSPQPPSATMDNKMYEFIDSMISKHDEEKCTGYKKKIQNLCKVLASMIEEIPETYFNEYMQECLKTLNNYQAAASYVVINNPTPTPDITSNVVNFQNMPQIQTASIQQLQTSSNVVNFPMQTAPMQQIPTSSNQQFPIPIATNVDITGPLDLAQFPAPANAPQILNPPSTTNTSNVTITSVTMIPTKNEIKDPDVFFNMTSQEAAPTTEAVVNSNFVTDTVESQEEYSQETQSEDFNDDALHNDGQIYN